MSTGFRSDCSADRSPRARYNLVYLGILALCMFLAWLTWRRSGDLLVDYGRELYVPWQLSEGALLYHDVHSLMGPAAAYLNSLIFKYAGASIGSMLAADLVIIVLIVTYLAWWFAQVVEPRTLFCILLAFLTLSAFSQPGGVSNYSFLTPYSHEATHGFVYALLSVGAISKFAISGSVRSVLVAGLALGAAFMTKPEIFVASMVACIVGWLCFVMWVPSTYQGPLRNRGLAFLGGSSLLPLAALGFFSAQLPLDEALRAVGGAWVHVPAVQALNSDYYRWVAGTDQLWFNAGMLALGALVVAGVLGAAMLLSMKIGWAYRRNSRVRIVLTASVGVIALATLTLYPWDLLLRGYPLLVAAVLAHCGLQVLRRDGSLAGRSFWLALTVWAAFSLAMLVKVLLAVRIIHYGFYLAIPATILFIVYGLEVLPRWLRRRGRDSAVLERTTMVIGLVFLMFYGSGSYLRVSAKDHPVGRPDDFLMYSSPELATQLNEVLRAIGDTEGSTTLAVIPEGAGLNFIAKRKNPTGHVSLLPPEYGAFGERSVLETFDARPPDQVVLWSRDLRRYGFGRFGVNASYADGVLRMLGSHYEVRQAFPAGEDWAEEPGFADFFVLWRIKDVRAR